MIYKYVKKVMIRPVAWIFQTARRETSATPQPRNPQETPLAGGGARASERSVLQALPTET